MHLTRVENSDTKRVSLFWHTQYTSPESCSVGHCKRGCSSQGCILHGRLNGKVFLRAMKHTYLNFCRCQSEIADTRLV